MTQPSRRRLFQIGTALPFAAVPPAAAETSAAISPDAALLALCAEFHRHHAAVQRLPATGDYTWEHAIDERWATSDDIKDMRPATEEGRRAKAAVALVMLEEQHGETGDADVRFALATLRDLAGRA